MAREREFTGIAPQMKKQSFIRTGEGAIASYDFDDMIRGVSYLIYYGSCYRLAQTGTGTYHSLENPMYPTISNTSYSDSGDHVGYVSLDDLDFNSAEFNSPLKIGGLFRVQLTMGSKRNNPRSITFRVRAVFKKISGATESTIGTTEYAYTTKFGDDADVQVKLLEVELPLTNFKIGDYFQITLERQVYSPNYAYNPVCIVWHDPLDTDAGTTWHNKTIPTTQLIFHVPFKIDL